MGAWCSTQDFSRNTADQHPGQFAPIVRRHNDQVGPFLLGALTMAAWGAGIDHLGRFQHSPASASSHEDDFRAVFDGMQCRTSRRRCFCSIA